MTEELGYICPQTKKQCDDECCVSAEDCHAEAINSIISNCEPEQLNQNKMKIETKLTAVEFIRQEFLEKLTNENYKNSFDEIINQAIEMEREQMKELINEQDGLSPINL